MAQPIWETPAGSLGVIPESIFFQQTLLAYDPDGSPVYYAVIAGSLPEGIQCTANGLIVGTPRAVASLQGVPIPVNQDVTSKFTVRAYTETVDEQVDRIRDRTFTLTISGNDVPEFTTPAGSLGSFYDGDQLDIQIGYTNTDPSETVVVSLAAGQLPGGITVSSTGLISGYIQPAANVTETPGYDLTPIYTLPYDFLVSAISKNYQFTLEVTDGKSSSLRTFYFFVYDRSTMTADTTEITADTTTVTTDETTERRPFLTNASPADLGTVRGDNYYAYQFIGNDYDTPDLRYAINVNQGSGLPPGLTLDPVSGWYYGYVPDQGVTEVEYSFNVVTYQADFATQSIVISRTIAGSNYIYTSGTGILTAGTLIQLADSFGGLAAATTYTVQTIVSQDAATQQVIFTVSGATLTNEIGSSVATLIIACSATTFGTNIITCNSTDQLGVGQAIVFTGTGFGGITAAPTQVYYVLTVNSSTQFTVTDNLSSDIAVDLTTSAGTMLANLIVASDPYPFVITISGAVAAEVTWLTPADLGSIENGDISLLVVEAVNRGGRELFYRLESGAFNELPQGLELLPTGEISGQVSFNTFAVDLGSTTYANQTTWDSSFTFTVNAYAADTEQIVYDVTAVTVTNGGSGYSSINPPVLVFSSPVGATAVQAQPGNVTVSGGAITSVEVADAGAGYSVPATITITEGFGGVGAVLTPVMRATGVRDVVSVYKTFTIRLIRAYNKPYQNLSVQAMPPTNDRVLVASLLDNSNIFVPDFIFRPDDPYFGKSSRVTYQHAFGLEPDTLETYVSSLYENHYWKNLVLGEINTAQAVDPVTGQVVYEVVYSKIIDDLVNNAGESVSKIVNLPYPITDPADGSTQITQVYPNSLVNMRNQVIDVVGQLSTKLPLWMTSKQTDGRVLGFTPAWVMCYVKPGYSRQIAYYIATEFGNQLNKVDFKVDRYILDASMSRNWDATTQNWTPEASLTTFDRFGSGLFPFLGYVDIATQLAYADVNQRTLASIAELGGLDGLINQINGNTIIFVKQEYYDTYPTIADAWQDYTTLYDNGPYSPETPGASFDESYTIPGGTEIECTNTAASTNYVKATNTLGLLVNDPVYFSGTTFGGINATKSNGLTQIYYVTSVVNSACTVTAAGTDLITCASTANMATDDQVWFTGATFGGVNSLTASNTVQLYYVTKISSTQFKISLTQGGAFVALSTATGSMTVNTRYFTVSTAQGGTNQVLSTASGSMFLNYGNQRMAVFTITVDPVTTLVTLSPTTLSTETQYVQINRGTQFAGQQLYYPTSPAEGYTVVNWITVPESNLDETTFDQGSMAFEAPVDMYDPTDRYDKYLVFPKANILV